MSAFKVSFVMTAFLTVCLSTVPAHAQGSESETLQRDDNLYSRPLRTADVLRAEQRVSSYGSLVRQGAYDSLGIFSRSCLPFIKKVYGQGGDFRSQVLAQQLYPLKNEKFLSGIHEKWFFHYTKSDKVVDAMKAALRKQEASALDEFYVYTRTHARDSMSWFTNLYIAEDPVSSSHFGDRQIRMDLSADAQVLRPNADIWRQAYSEISARYPEAQNACPYFSYSMADRFDAYGDRAVYSSIFLLMAEDSGADLISYGNGTSKTGNMICKDAPAHSVCGRWYQLLNPTIIGAVGAP